MVKRGGASKFPVARIKKIMQADEDIGKVAQATPVVISKALELFLVDLIKSAAEETRSAGARKVTAYHLKRAVHTRETLDFLKDIVQGVPDPVQTSATLSAAGGTASRKRGPSTKGKKEDESEDDDEAGESETDDDRGDPNDEDDYADRRTAKKVKQQR